MRQRVPFPPGQFRGPVGPFEYPGPGFRGHGMGHAVFPWLFLLLFAALVAVAVVALVRYSSQGRSRLPSQMTPLAGPPYPDRALEDLKLRYVKGEIDRDEYLQKATDLGERRPAAYRAQDDAEGMR